MLDNIFNLSRNSKEVRNLGMIYFNHWKKIQFEPWTGIQTWDHPISEHERNHCALLKASVHCYFKKTST